MLYLNFGMALMQLGRERCILLSDFDSRATGFELPSDMNSLEIFFNFPRSFCRYIVSQGVSL